MRTLNSHDQGFLELLNGTILFVSHAIYAVLVRNAHGTPNRATETQYSHITNQCTDPDYSRQALTSKTLALDGTAVRYSHAKVTFTASGNVSGRYVYLVRGTAGTPQATDRIIGHIDLTGGGDSASINSEFAYMPGVDGLFRLPRTIAA